MRLIKFHFSLIIAILVLCTITSFTIHTANKQVTKQAFVAQTPVSIDLLNDGSFTATGGLNQIGTYSMDVQLKGQSHVSAIRCSVVLTPSDNSGTITLKMNCQFSTDSGQWQIVSGTGTYTNLKGNGSLDMNAEGEFLHGKIM